MLTIMEVKGVYSDVALSATPTPYRVYIYIIIITIIVMIIMMRRRILMILIIRRALWATSVLDSPKR